MHYIQKLQTARYTDTAMPVFWTMHTAPRLQLHHLNSRTKLRLMEKDSDLSILLNTVLFFAVISVHRERILIFLALALGLTRKLQ